MCINYQTSSIAFLIGEISGLILTLESDDRKMVGLFVMFYSLIQFFEANIHYYGQDASSIYSRLLLMNLGFQGLVFFILMGKIIEVNNYYFLICGIISLFIVYRALSTDFKKADVANCLKWNFMEHDTVIALTIMYVIIFYWYSTSKVTKSNYNSKSNYNFKSNYNSKSNSNADINFINNTGIFFATTFALSYLIFNKNSSPGIWCLLSAIIAPMFLIL